MSFNYDRYERRPPAARSRSTFGYWVPLVLTVTVATAGLAAWVWSERGDDEDESSEDDDLSYGDEADGKTRRGSNRNNSNNNSNNNRNSNNRNSNNTTTTHAPLERDHSGLSQGVVPHDDLMARVQGVIRRTPSPQQVFDTVSKKTAAGWAAAGAALASIREEDKDDYGDHNRWSEEAAIRRSLDAHSAQSASAVDEQARAFAASVRGGGGGAGGGGAAAAAAAAPPAAPPAAAAGKRKTVVLVVSAESLMDAHDDDTDAAYRSENATLLSHLADTDFAKTKLFVLIYAPALRSHPHSRSHSRSHSRDRSSPLGSSYSAISTPGEELTSIDPQPDHELYTPALSARSSDTLLWNTLHAQALPLVEHPAMVMPFTTPSGFVHMLRHLRPDLVYLVDALTAHGRNVDDIKRWVGQTVVVVGSDGTGLGRLVDTDDEAPPGKAKASEHHEHHVSRWWEDADTVGLGKGVEIVDASRFEDDFDRRVGGRE
ncbi:uncharacterized protein EKO05_0007115 [Ascochyta rabiei]|uniref:Uncharacterized protein n=1 Tax=Didymella rabiei TaxID=5454 RepID=A0A163G664_DIDRA|nr:uncharacterized protein EKO05_0007115 [Ascochyta rabiei]KZM24700.1 hypothetical protein ST47_g4138 [Ascochyta rabiei]UPX16728.1 hypothetical protein EKO05_0007115 [Ascochyta rabiei]